MKTRLVFLSACALAALAAGVAASCASDTPTSTDGGTADASTSIPADAASQGIRPDASSQGIPPDAATIPDDAATTVDSDASTLPSDAASVGVTCGATTCAVGEVCCGDKDDAGTVTTMCASSCADGGFGQLACDGPEDCPNSQFCCGDIFAGPGSPPSCPIDHVSSQCTATCNAAFSFSCNSKQTSRLCHAQADCAGEPSGATNCCTFSDGTNSATFCVPSSISFFADSCAQ